MPFVPNTPESLIGRTDSKNPATTCRGITSGGRPCRRPLNATPDGSQPSPPVVTARGRANRLRVDDPRDPDLYCWQHKDQAKSSARSSPGPASRNKLGAIRQGSVESLESLIGRLGIVEAERTGQKQNGKPTKPFYNQGTEKPPQPNYNNGPNPSNFQQEEKPRKSRGLCCCFTSPVFEEEEEEEQPSRPNPRPIQATPMRPGAAKLPSNQHLAPPSSSQRPSLATSKQSSGQSATSQTSQYLSLIPPSALPETAANLMKELSKPYAVNDEPGYIYIFWLTPESQPSGPPTEAAKNLLTPHPRPEMRQRGTSDVLRSFATQSTQPNKADAPAKTILVKIGRASNVQRRMNEWQRQCGYNLSLIRYYPYVSSSQPSTPRKMPHSHKVERLIHIELEGQGLRVKPKASCDTCGRNHREWFEVEATRAGINTIDEVVRRWSDWDEGNPQRFQ